MALSYLHGQGSIVSSYWTAHSLHQSLPCWKPVLLEVIVPIQPAGDYPDHGFCMVRSFPLDGIQFILLQVEGSAKSIAVSSGILKVVQNGV